MQTVSCFQEVHSQTLSDTQLSLILFFCILMSIFSYYIFIILLFRVLEILQNIASGKEELDMERMKAQIHRSVLEEMNAVSYFSL